MQNYLMEFIGTIFFVLAVGLIRNLLAIRVMVYMRGHTLGGALAAADFKYLNLDE